MATEARGIWDGLRTNERKLLVASTQHKVYYVDTDRAAARALFSRRLIRSGRATDLGRAVVEAGKTAETDSDVEIDAPTRQNAPAGLYVANSTSFEKALDSEPAPETAHSWTDNKGMVHTLTPEQHKIGRVAFHLRAIKSMVSTPLATHEDYEATFKTISARIEKALKELGYE